MKLLVENERAHGYVRSAALRGIMTLVARDARSRDEILGYFRHLFLGGLEREHSKIWDSLAVCSLDLYPKEIYQEINRACDEGLIDPFAVDKMDIQETLNLNVDETMASFKKNSHYCYVKDPVREMEWWACFEQPNQKRRSSQGKAN